MERFQFFLVFLYFYLPLQASVESDVTLISCESSRNEAKLIFWIAPPDSSTDCDATVSSQPCVTSQVDYTLIVDLSNPAGSPPQPNLRKIIDSVTLPEGLEGALIVHEDFQLSLPPGLKSGFKNKRLFTVQLESFVTSAHQDNTLSFSCHH